MHCFVGLEVRRNLHRAEPRQGRRGLWKRAQPGGDSSSSRDSRSPSGTRCNLVVPQLGMKRGGGDGRRTPQGVPHSAESTFSIFPPQPARAKMLKVSRKDALVITTLHSASSAFIDCLSDVMRRELCLTKMKCSSCRWWTTLFAMHFFHLKCQTFPPVT